MSGEYRGRDAVLRVPPADARARPAARTATELQYVVADDERAVAVYRARGEREGRELDIEQALFCVHPRRRLADVTAVPLDFAASTLLGMKVGVQLPEVEREVRWPELAAMARAAEESGFDSLWVGDHLLYRGDGRRERGPWDCWTTLAALAAVTERVELGPLVACTAFRPPGILARAAAAVDEVSGGRAARRARRRLERGGVPRVRLAVRPAHLALRGGVRDRPRACSPASASRFHGAFNDLEDAVLLPPPARRAPLMVGGDGPRLLAATLPHVDWWNTWFDALRQPRRRLRRR